MTLYGWDASHYDGTLTKAILTKAKGEGISFFTHKIGEGVSNVDTTQATALAAARSAGIQVLGGYWFIHGNDSAAAEVAAMIRALDKYEPWWRTHPCFFIQCDAETSPTGLPSAAYVKQWCDEAAKQTGKVVVCYASHGMYGNKLAGLGHPLWNANYGSNKAGAFKSIYPGNTYAGWTAYSGQTPLLCQFSSKATIAGRTTCDANAFRGTLAQLTAALTKPKPVQPPEDDMSAAEVTQIVGAIGTQAAHSPQFTKANGKYTRSLSAVVDNVEQKLAAIIDMLTTSAKVEAAMTAALASMPAGVEITQAALQAALVGALQEVVTDAPGTQVEVSDTAE